MPADLSSLASTIERLHAAGADADRTEARSVFATLRAELSAGRARAASPDPDSPTGWTVNAWVKQGILVGFRCGEIISVPGDAPHVPFLDKDTLPLRSLDTSSRVRLVPGGSSIRDGAFIGAGVICMPPMFINIGAYVGADSLIDSHALVGSCAQIGERVHVSAGAQIGGVLEPLQAEPVIIEDNCFIGARSEVAEGVVVEEGAVLSMGVYIGASTKIVDRASGEIFYGRVPAYSVVVSGTLPAAEKPPGDNSPNPSLYCAVIVKRVDERTRSKTSINELLRA